MPLRPVCRRRDEIENLLDGLAYLDAVANARHPNVRFRSDDREFSQLAQIVRRVQLAESIRQCHVTTKRSKDTKIR